ncbi:MAG: hypothetical protein JWQ04_2934, partial [Pedosphaera sp.]|nr:hypothetical protein [Pedosphaera sp.]
MAERTPKRWWRITRVCLRGIRVGILLVALVLLLITWWLNTVGLPAFLKRPLIAQLHAQGLDLQFSRLRWRWKRGIVAEDVRVGAAQSETNNPQLSIKEAELRVNHHALSRFKLQVDSLLVHDGRLFWPLDEPDQPPASLLMTNIQTQFRFLPGDQWELDHFSADFAGAKLQLAGSLTNALALRDWKLFHGGRKAQPELLRARLRALALAVDRIKFVQPPELNVVINADARDVRTFNGRLTLDAKGAVTPWGALTNGTLLVWLTPPAGTNNLPHVKFQLHTDEMNFTVHPTPAQTLAGGTKHFELDLDASGDEEITNLVRARLEISAGQFSLPWGQAANAHFTARWTHSLTNAIPLAGTGELRLTNAQSKWGTAGQLRLIASMGLPVTSHPPQTNAGWGWWASLAPYFLDWNGRVENIRANGFESKEVLCGGTWRAPVLTI